MNLPETLVEDETRKDALFPAIDAIEGNGVFVELGTFLGGNFVRCIKYAEEKNKDIIFYAVDDWLFENISTEGLKFTEGKPYYTAFLDNMSQIQKTSWFAIKGNTVDKETVENFSDKSIDILFIDDGHQYPHTKNVLNLWIPKVKSGGLICGHDWSCEGVDLAIKECLNDEYISNGHSYWKRM